MKQVLPEPPENMAELDWFLGEWDVVSRSKNQEEEWKEELVSSDHTLILGGHVILEHFLGPLMGKAFEAWSLRKFNPAATRWEQRWVDTTPGGFADWTGHWNDSTREFIGHPNRVLRPDGGLETEAVREVFFDIKNDQFSWRYEVTDDGGGSWTPTWLLEYLRSDV